MPDHVDNEATDRVQDVEGQDPVPYAVQKSLHSPTVVALPDHPILAMLRHGNVQVRHRKGDERERDCQQETGDHHRPVYLLPKRSEGEQAAKHIGNGEEEQSCGHLLHAMELHAKGRLSEPAADQQDHRFAENERCSAKGQDGHAQVKPIPDKRVYERENEQADQEHAKADERRNKLRERQGLLELRHCVAPATRQLNASRK